MTLALLLAILQAPPQVQYPHRTATVTAYCSACSGDVDQCGAPLRRGTVAADTWLHHGHAPAGALHVNGRRWRWYWVGDRIRFGAPIDATLTVRDCGSAIRGRDRFDWSRGIVGECRCGSWGRRRVGYRVVGVSR